MGLLSFMLVGFLMGMVGLYSLGMFYAASKGWKYLSKRFKFEDELDGTDLGWPDFYVGGANYKKGVNLYATQRGLQLKVQWTFAMAHPALLIPWHEIEESTQDRSERYHFTKLVFGSKEQVEVELPTHIWEKMQGYLIPGPSGTGTGLLN